MVTFRFPSVPSETNTRSMKWHSYLNSAKNFISQYKGDQPFHLFLKEQFRANKKMGSRDRKWISRLCYGYFRLGHSVRHLSLEDQLLAGLFFSADAKDEMILALKPDWAALQSSAVSMEQKISGFKKFDSKFEPEKIFPFEQKLSEGINESDFSLSHLIQPDLFIRVRPGHQKPVEELLTKAGINFRACSEDCIALPNGSAIEQVLQLNKQVVVQDKSSQRIGEAVRNLNAQQPGRFRTVWDACAASGGKSILLYDLLPEFQLYVSDIRKSILYNLSERFRFAGIKNYDAFVADLSAEKIIKEVVPFEINSIDLILLDVPCSGSGTWGRTPEYLRIFDESEVDRYAALQRKIITNSIPYLKRDGVLVYSTCSVFQKENEDSVNFILLEQGLNLLYQQVIKGYHEKADSMFVAMFGY